MLPNLNSVLYLDADTIVCGDLTYLAELAARINSRPLEEPLAYATTDIGAMHLPRLASVGFEMEKYFNSGVMVVNLERWRQGKLTEKMFGLEKAQRGKFHWLDQDILNIMLAESWEDFGSEFNHYSRTLQNTTRIIHFTGPKPDRIGSRHPATNLYRRHRLHTPYPLVAPRGIIRYLFVRIPRTANNRLYKFFKTHVLPR